MLNDSDLKRIEDGLKGLDTQLTIIYHPPAEPGLFSKEMEEGLNKIKEAGGGLIDLEKGEDSGMPALPAFSISCKGQSNIHYLSLPEGPEAIVFVETLIALSKGAQDFSDQWAQKLSGIQTPADIWVFMATTCSNCPQAVRFANQLAVVSSQVNTYIIDAQRFEDIAGRHKVMSVPHIVIDEEWSHVGVVPPDDLVEQLLAREEQDYQVKVFASLIENNRIDEAAAQIINGPGAGLLLENWRTSTTSTRMGFMFAAETALEEDLRCMDSIVDGLVPVLQNEDASLRGDTVDLLGRIGLSSARGAIEALLNDPNPDVAEIAAEVLEEFEE